MGGSPSRQILIGADFRDSAGWHKLLRKWQDVMDDYVRHTEDVPYWYNERANVGFVAAAVWKLGGVAIEEYSIDKQSHKAKGRADLRFYIPRFEMKYSVEAKVQWPGGSTNANAECDRLLGRAAEQIKQHTRDKGYLRMALLFVAPDTSDYRKGKDLLRELHRLLKTADTRKQLVALYEPHGTKKVRYQEKSKTRYCPGVLLIGNLLR